MAEIGGAASVGPAVLFGAAERYGGKTRWGRARLKAGLVSAVGRSNERCRVRPDRSASTGSGWVADFLRLVACAGPLTVARKGW